VRGGAVRPEPDTPAAELVDVSRWQGPLIDWQRVAAAGIVGAYLKIGQGLAGIDESFLANWIASRAAGLLRGAYFFLAHDEDAAAQARHCLALLSQVAPGELRLCLDVETAWHGGPVGEAARAFVAEVAPALGYEPLVYTYAAFLPALPPGLGPLWCARYSSTPPTVPAPWKLVAWQFSGNARVDGIAGPVDRTHALDLDALRVP
jgi:lysozyme